MRIQRKSLAALVGVTFVTAACTGDAPTLQVPEAVQSLSGCSGSMAHFEVSPSSMLVRVGESAPVSASGYTTNGCFPDGWAYWSSTNAQVATVSPTTTWGFGGWHSTVTGVAPGTATVQGSFDNASDVSYVTVYQPVLTSITVAPGWTSVSAGHSTWFSATGYDQHGRVCSNFCGAPAPSWSVDHPSIASISSDGMATGLAEGNTTVRATSGSVSAGAGLNVTGGCIPEPPALVCDPR